MKNIEIAFRCIIGIIYLWCLEYSSNKVMEIFNNTSQEYTFGIALFTICIFLLGYIIAWAYMKSKYEPEKSDPTKIFRL